MHLPVQSYFQLPKCICIMHMTIIAILVNAPSPQKYYNLNLPVIGIRCAWGTGISFSFNYLNCIISFVTILPFFIWLYVRKGALKLLSSQIQYCINYFSFPFVLQYPDLIYPFQMSFKLQIKQFILKSNVFTTNLLSIFIPQTSL